MPDGPGARVYRGAVIGLGGVARASHLPAFRDPRTHGRLCIEAIVDSDRRVSSVDGIPLFRSVEALGELAPLDFVDVCTPTGTHVEMTLWALSHGYHVVCEKPVAVTRRDAVTIAKAARATRRVVYPCHQYRFNPAWRTVRGWLDEGRIGDWHLAQFEVHRLAADTGAARSGVPWRGRRRDGLGGVLLDHGTHLIYQMLDVAGRPAAVRAWTGRLRHAVYDVEDTAQLLFAFPNRAVSFFLTWAGHRRENRIRFVGARGSIEWNGGLLTLESDSRTESHDFTSQLDKSAYAGWFAEMFQSFADAMDSGDAEPHLDDIRSVAEVLEAAYAAAADPGIVLGPRLLRRARVRGAR
jgi:predicted dehydrogenase